MRSGHFQESYTQQIALTDDPAVKVWTALLLVALLAVPFITGTYTLSLASKVLFLAIGAVGLNLLMGMTGLISLGSAGFFAVGAYTNAILTVDYDWPVLAGLMAAGIVSAAVSLLVGVPSLRLKGLYLAITTLAFSFIVSHVILYADGLTRGSQGIQIGERTVFGFSLGDDRVFYYFCLAICTLLTIAAFNLRRTRIGRAWLAIRDHDIAASVMGVNIVAYKLLAFMISSFYIGIAGALMSMQIQFVNVDIFDLLLSIEVVVIIILGGLGSTVGAILGTILIVALPELIEIALALLGASAFFADYRFQIESVLYGVIIVLILRFEPRGLMGIYRSIRRFFWNWPLSY